MSKREELIAELERLQPIAMEKSTYNMSLAKNGGERVVAARLALHQLEWEHVTACNRARAESYAAQDAVARVQRQIDAIDAKEAERLAELAIEEVEV
jgi:hypothetical protein